MMTRDPLRWAYGQPTAITFDRLTEALVKILRDHHGEQSITSTLTRLVREEAAREGVWVQQPADD